MHGSSESPQDMHFVLSLLNVNKYIVQRFQLMQCLHMLSSEGGSDIWRQDKVKIQNNKNTPNVREWFQCIQLTKDNKCIKLKEPVVF